MPIINELNSIFLLKQGKNYLEKRESSTLEYKKSFSLDNMSEYGKDFASFANNSGGLIIFGVEDIPHIPVGLQNNKFINIDESRITEYLNDHFSPSIYWEKYIYKWNNCDFGIFYIYEANNKPIIATLDGGKNVIKNGEIYYRYIGRSEKIKHAELEKIIEERIRYERDRWEKLFKKIGKIGLQNISVLNTLDGTIEDEKRTILIDDELIQKLKFIKEGEFNKKKGAATLRLIGDIAPLSITATKNKIIHDDPYVFKATDVAKKVESEINKTFRTTPEHANCWKYYKIRGSQKDGKASCNPEYCDYKESLERFMYTQKWVEYLITELSDLKKYKNVIEYKKDKQD
jgi:hypothetical protein